VPKESQLASTSSFTPSKKTSQIADEPYACSTVVTTISQRG
jgi:hypothetical protein